MYFGTSFSFPAGSVLSSAPAAPAAPVVASSVLTKQSENAGSITANWPSGVTDGDLLVALYTKNGTSGSLEVPSGWTEIGSEIGSGHETSLQWKVAASEGATQVFEIGGGGTDKRQLVIILRITGANVSPVDVHGSATGNSSTPGCPEVTTLSADTLLLRLISSRETTISVGGGNPSGTTLLHADHAGSFSVSGGAAYSTQATAGATGAAAWTISTADNWTAWTIAIRP